MYEFAAAMSLDFRSGEQHQFVKERVGERENGKERERVKEKEQKTKQTSDTVKYVLSASEVGHRDICSCFDKRQISN